MTIIFRTTLIIILSIPLSAFAQSPRDSINLLLAVAQQKLKINKIEEAEAVARKALIKAQAKRYSLDEARALHIIGQACYYLNKTDEALNVYTEAKELFVQQKDSVQAGLVLDNIGRLYLMKLHQVAPALDYFKQSLLLLKNDSASMVYPLKNMGTLQSRSGHYAAALDLYALAGRLAQKYNNLDVQSNVLNNMATVYWRMQDYGSSIPYFKQALLIDETLENTRRIANGLGNLSIAYKELNDLETALQYAEQAVMQARACACYDELVYSLIALSDLQQKTNALKKSEATALEALTISRQYNVLQHLKFIYDRLSEVYQASGNLTEALLYKDKLAHLNDSLAQAERKALTTNTKLIPEERKASAKDSSLTPIIIIAVGVLLLCITAFYIWRKRLSSSQQQHTSSQNIHEATETTFDQHLEVIHGEGSALVPLDQILWVEKEDKHYFVQSRDRKYRLRQTINTLETWLPEDKFFRINRSVIINLESIDNYSFWEHHKYIIRMKDDARTEFTITRERLKLLKERYQIVA